MVANDQEVQGFAHETPGGKAPVSTYKWIGRIVFWLIIAGIIVFGWQTIVIVVVCTAGIGLIPLAAITITFIWAYRLFLK